MIKLDIVNAVLRKFEEEGVAVSRVKAEQAVETVFESLKNAPWARASASNCGASASSACARARPALAAIRVPAKKSAFRQAKLSASSPAKNCKASKTPKPPKPELADLPQVQFA